MWVNLAKLVQEKTPDRAGTVFPTTVGSATYEVQDLAPQGKNLVATDLAVNTATATVVPNCMICCSGYRNIGFDINYVDFLPFDVDPLRIVGTYSCDGEVYGINTEFDAWGSSNSAVAQVTTAQAKAIFPGQATGYADGYIPVPNAGCACPYQPREVTVMLTVIALNCPPSVTRGATATCTLTGHTASNWSFKDGQGNTVTRSTNTTSLSWSGTMVTSGTVSVMSSAGRLSASITVTNRSGFTFTAVQPHKETNPYTCVSSTGVSPILSVNNPPQPAVGSNFDYIGQYCDIEDYSYNFTTISDNGPNNGFSYITSGTNNASFHWIIAQDADNPSSAFYLAQCGNYNSSTRTGFISGSQLNTNIVRHESAPVQGHYGNYVNVQNNSANNVGTGLESAVNLSSGSTFTNWVNTYIAPRISALHASTQSPEPYDANHDQNGVYDGPINFQPYASCQ